MFGAQAKQRRGGQPSGGDRGVWVLLPGGEGVDGMLGKGGEGLKSAGTCRFLLETGELWEV